MPVLKTASPNVSPSAPKASPWKVRPSSRTRIAGRGRRGPEGAGLSGDAGACRGTPYLLLRLTGRIVKGCRATPTLPARRPGTGDGLRFGHQPQVRSAEDCGWGPIRNAARRPRSPTGPPRERLPGLGVGLVDAEGVALRVEVVALPGHAG